MTSIYKDKSKQIEERVNDLIDQMTTEEKIGQLGQVCMAGYSNSKEKR